MPATPSLQPPAHGSHAPAIGQPRGHVKPVVRFHVTGGTPTMGNRFVWVDIPVGSVTGRASVMER